FDDVIPGYQLIPDVSGLDRTDRLLFVLSGLKASGRFLQLFQYLDHYSSSNYSNLMHQKLLAHPRGTAVVADVGDVLVPEVLKSGEDRVGRGLTQPAEGGVFH